MKRLPLFLTCALVLLPLVAEGAPRVTVFDDGVKLRGERERPLPKSPWPDGPIEQFALRGETLGLELVVDADEGLSGLHVEIVFPKAPTVEAASFSQRFVHVKRPSGNDREPGSLAFTKEAAPLADAFVGLLADALVPRPLALERGARGALWVDLHVPESTAAGAYDGELLVSSTTGIVARRALRLEVGASALPYMAAKVSLFYDPSTLDKRMGSRAAEPSLRRLFHEHHLSAFAERRTPDAIDLDLEALRGDLYRPPAYRGPGVGVGEGVFAIGAYGSLGEPTPPGLKIVEQFVERIEKAGALPSTTVFLYAVDEDCKSPRASRWRALLEGSPARRHVKVGATCHESPLRQAAELTMLPATSYDAFAADAARAQGKLVWAYNGLRPHAGPLMLDVPATDLRANAWISERYRVERWFYWESTYVLDQNRGGQGGAVGWDPYVVAETFHNADGDYAMGDGNLVYPGKQLHGMTSFNEDAFYPSVRLKNLRRGVLDAGYIQLAKERDPLRADALVRRMIPGALREVQRVPAAWSSDADDWRKARRELFEIIRGPKAAPPNERFGPSPLGWAAAIATFVGLAGVGLRGRKRS